MVCIYIHLALPQPTLTWFCLKRQAEEEKWSRGLTDLARFNRSRTSNGSRTSRTFYEAVV